MLELGGAGNAASGGGDIVKDGSDAGFMADVIEGSRGGAVVVQFTADWCGPCKTLGPQLETAVRKHGGKVKLVRIDIDKNPQFASQLRVQSIPAVYGFVDGQPVDGFMGVQPQSQLEQFVAQLASGAGPSDAESQIAEVLDAADAAVEQGASGDAAQAYAQVLQLEPENIRAIAGLARCYVVNRDFDRARETLALAPADKAEDPLLVQVTSMISLAEAAGSGGGDAAALAAAVEANPDDHQSRFDLALALVGSGQAEPAVEHLLELFRRDREWNDDAAREQLLKVFEALGPSDPLTLKGRRRLSSLVFA